MHTTYHAAPQVYNSEKNRHSSTNTYSHKYHSYSFSSNFKKVETFPFTEMVVSEVITF